MNESWTLPTFGEGELDEEYICICSGYPQAIRHLLQQQTNFLKDYELLVGKLATLTAVVEEQHKENQQLRQRLAAANETCLNECHRNGIDQRFTTKPLYTPSASTRPAAASPATEVVEFPTRLTSRPRRLSSRSAVLKPSTRRTNC